MLLDVLISTARSCLLGRAQRFTDENTAHSADAPRHIDRDIRTLAIGVYQYQERFEQARLTAFQVKTSSFDQLLGCDTVITLGEIAGITTLIQSIKNLGELSTSLEDRAIARVRSQMTAIEEDFKRQGLLLQRMMEHGGGTRMKSNFHYRIRALARELSRRMQDSRSIDLYGNDLEALCAELVGILSDVRRKLLENREQFTFFAKDCQMWKREQRAQGVY
ncbi:hypothetical protein [Alkalilimnicola sp. S0819]|uniref:hypothetical protein n=1 Tax=Alkalilimnicola sp. S0819 TaxID=2613922 RepID=UPI001261DDDB|nr:hypothetical protein [Alkalilimnicola sp. S0819]KAB7623223.1 hypothetical protein F3N43_10540 [Alkalilimnicola sp. S0819]MPQ17072.1 hypothetical protein [Alkalilimnicola sp. S0819]